MISNWGAYFPKFLPGRWWTLRLTGAATLVGLPAGVLLASLSSARSRLVRWTSILVVEIGRGAPGLIVLYLVYYGLPQAHVTWTNTVSAIVALSFTMAAYSSEVIRAGIKAVPHGQKEASQALGLSALNEFRLVVLPQAIKIVIPPLIGLVIILYQGTSLAYAIAVPELLSKAYNEGTVSFQFMPPLILAGLMYAAISLAGLILLRVRWPSRRVARTSTEPGSVEALATGTNALQI